LAPDCSEDWGRYREGGGAFLQSLEGQSCRKDVDSGNTAQIQGTLSFIIYLFYALQEVLQVSSPDQILTSQYCNMLPSDTRFREANFSRRDPWKVPKRRVIE
jgi:hypothetical protein